jgi:6-phosphogluconolactonase
MAKEALFDHVPLPGRNIHRILTELPPEAAAQLYEQTLSEFFDQRTGPARFDLVLLGMGDDGHTASLFPYTVALDETERLVVANHVAQLDTWRITLTYPVINYAVHIAVHIAFLVSGAGKAAPLKAVLEGPLQPKVLPSQGVQPIDGDLIWLVDQGAAALLEEGT